MTDDDVNGGLASRGGATERPPTTIALTLILEPERSLPDPAALGEALRRAAPDGASVEGSRWPLRVHGPVEATLAPGEVPTLNRFQLARSLLDAGALQRLGEATCALTLTLRGSGMLPMGVLHQGLGLVRPALGDLLAVHDPAAASALPGPWAASVATAPVPPRPEALFGIHAVHHEEAGRVWLHTHGLLRAGLPELEILEAPVEHAHVLGHLLGAVASRVLTEGLPDDGEPVAWGHGAVAALVPWAEVQDLARTQGGPADRDAYHPEHARVLAVPGDDAWASVAELAPFGEHPVFYRSSWETSRMEALARWRWELFARLQGALAADARFRFLAKVGFAGPQAIEHLWFEVREARRDGFVGELLNAPHQDLGVRRGDVGTHALEHLSDVAVHTPVGSVDAEALPRLAAWVEAGLPGLGE